MNQNTENCISLENNTSRKHTVQPLKRKIQQKDWELFGVPDTVGEIRGRTLIWSHIQIKKAEQIPKLIY